MSQTRKKKGPLDLTDAELRQAYRDSIETVQFYTNDFYREIERRTQEKHSKAMLALTWAIGVLTLIATVAAIISVLRVVCAKG